MTLHNVDQYGHNFQIKVLASLLLNKEFLLNINEMITEEYFANPAHKWVVMQVKDYFSKYHSTPSMEVLKTEMKKVNNDVLKLSIKEQLQLAYSDNREDQNYIETEFFNFCRNQELKRALLDSVDLLQSGEYDQIRDAIDKALKSGQDKNLGHEYNKDTAERYKENDRNVVPTPWPKINDLLQGGLGKGDLGIVLGGPGTGKSHTLISIGTEVLKLGYNVIHYTLELSEDYVGRRYDSCLTEIDVNEITKHQGEVNNIVNNLKGNLIIKEYPPKRASITTLENHIKKCIDLGIKPDLIIVDYLDLLTTKTKHKENKDMVDDIYVAAKGLAKTLKLPIFSVSQVNRSGASSDIVEGDKIAGSYDKIMISDFCMSISRKKEDKVNGTFRAHIMKNRYGADGHTYNGKIDTKISKLTLLDKFDDSDPTNYMSKDFNQNNLSSFKQLLTD